ncbi:heparinase [Echinicola soli]|uniref:Heparinase n=1 Tax=Echinicola soli TaxID=2591634 RepID=A0A514CLX5_9BACT|nr:heparinase II/III family protein [Echinicola soli]QDH80798.1 heparinase [Echinicola soli]
MVIGILFGVTLQQVRCQPTDKNSIERYAHPRIFFQKEAMAELKGQISKNAHWEDLDKLVMGEAEKLLSSPKLTGKIQGKNRINQSREAIRRVLFLGYAYHMTRQPAYQKKAKEELLNICSFEDWNPEVFLDLAEITMAAAVGYDWLYPQLSKEERGLVSRSILKKGLEPSYDQRYSDFQQLNNNWGQVINAALCLGAVSVYESYPDIAQKTIDRSLRLTDRALEEYCPDGIYPEGFMYWIYGSSYSSMMFYTLENLQYKKAQLPECFLKSGAFYTHMIGQTGEPFNWSDVFSVTSFNPAIFWMAKELGDLSLLWNEKQLLENQQTDDLKEYRLLPVTLLMGASLPLEKVTYPDGLCWAGNGTNAMAVMRSSWEDPSALFLGFKLGNPREHHGHMDMGSFILEADGVRWAIDMPMQNYHAAVFKHVKLWDDKQHGDRWSLTRTSNHGHNTLTLDDSLMDVGGKAELIRWGDREGFQFAIGDLSDTFLRKDRKINRGVGIKEKEYVIIRDEIAASDKGVNVCWKMVTKARIKVKDNEAILEKAGKTLRLKISSPKNAKIHIRPVNNHGQSKVSHKGAKLVGFDIDVKEEESAVIEVLLIPGSVSVPPEFRSLPLSEW